jgi:hypothetical protein
MLTGQEWFNGVDPSGPISQTGTAWNRRDLDTETGQNAGIFRGTERRYGTGGEEWQLRRCI